MLGTKIHIIIYIEDEISKKFLKSQDFSEYGSLYVS